MKILSTRTLFLSVLCGITMVSFSACTSHTKSGGLFNGKFVDNEVAGADYKCGTKTDITKSNGVFGPCPKGTTVTISLGDVVLGSVGETSDHIVTPQDLVGTSRGDVSDSQVKKIAKLILSLDADGNFSNGITIVKSAKDILNEKLGTTNGEVNILDLNDTNITTVVTQVKNEIDSNSSLKSQVAQEAGINVTDINLTVPDDSNITEHLNKVETLINDGKITRPPQPADNATD